MAMNIDMGRPEPNTLRHCKNTRNIRSHQYKKRIQSVLNIEQPDHKTLQPDCLCPFVGNPREDMPDGLPFNLEEYVELVDLTDRQIREGKKIIRISNYL